MTVALLDVALLGFVVGAAVATALLRDVLASIIAFSVFSLGIAIVWVVLGAPDVGLTEAAVGAGVMTILFVVTLVQTVRPQRDQVFVSVQWVPLAAVTAFVVVMLSTIATIPTIGDPEAPAVSYRVTQYYLANAYAETGVENVVTAVLASFRAFDTLGEAIVVFAAGVGLLVVLRQEVGE